MLRSDKDLKTLKIGAVNGTIGGVKDFYFDDDAWAVRYVVVDTGFWLGREVLISPFSTGTPDWDRHILPVTVTKEQVRHCPLIDTDKPVSRQHETSYLGYYGYPLYWGGNGLWGEGAYPGSMLEGAQSGASDLAYANALAANDRAAHTDEQRRRAHEDPHLRSCNAVVGYHIHAMDGDIGHVHGFLIDERTWGVQYLIVHTSNWWLGHTVLVPPAWIGEVSWEYSKVTVKLNRQQIKDAPTYDPQALLSRSDEEGIYRHYGHRGYWLDPKQRAVA